jgi:hypothetical protein
VVRRVGHVTALRTMPGARPVSMLRQPPAPLGEYHSRRHVGCRCTSPRPNPCPHRQLKPFSSSTSAVHERSGSHQKPTGCRPPAKISSQGGTKTKTIEVSSGKTASGCSGLCFDCPRTASDRLRLAKNDCSRAKSPRSANREIWSMALQHRRSDVEAPWNDQNCSRARARRRQSVVGTESGQSTCSYHS